MNQQAPPSSVDDGLPANMTTTVAAFASSQYSGLYLKICAAVQDSKQRYQHQRGGVVPAAQESVATNLNNDGVSYISINDLVIAYGRWQALTKESARSDERYAWPLIQRTDKSNEGATPEALPWFISIWDDLIVKNGLDDRPLVFCHLFYAATIMPIPGLASLMTALPPDQSGFVDVKRRIETDADGDLEPLIDKWHVINGGDDDVASGIVLRTAVKIYQDQYCDAIVEMAGWDAHASAGGPRSMFQSDLVQPPKKVELVKRFDELLLLLEAAKAETIAINTIEGGDRLSLENMGELELKEDLDLLPDVDKWIRDRSADVVKGVNSKDDGDEGKEHELDEAPAVGDYSRHVKRVLADMPYDLKSPLEVFILRERLRYSARFAGTVAVYFNRTHFEEWDEGHRNVAWIINLILQHLMPQHKRSGPLQPYEYDLIQRIWQARRSFMGTLDFLCWAFDRELSEIKQIITVMIKAGALPMEAANDLPLA